LGLSQRQVEQPFEEPSGLEHNLAPYFPELSSFGNSAEMEASALYARLKPEVDRVMDTVIQEEFSDSSERKHPEYMRAVAWNIERGNKLEGILEVLEGHPDLCDADVRGVCAARWRA